MVETPNGATDGLDREALLAKLRQTETALQASEERYRLVLDSARDHAILTTDNEGRITSWSAGAEAAFGWSAAEIEGQPAAILFLPEDQAAGVPAQELGKARRDGYSNDERWHLTKTGGRVFMNGSVHPLLPDAHNRARGFMKIARNETQKRRDADALRESEERYRTLFETIDEGFCVIRFIDGPFGALSDYVHVEANPAFEHHLGVSNAVGQTLRNMVTEAEAAGWLELYGGVLRSGQSLRFERQFGPGGRFLEVAAHRLEPAERREVAVLFTDVTARHQALADLRASEALARENIQRVQLALEAGAIIGTWFWDLPTDRFTVDEACARAFGLDPALGRVGLSLEQIIATVHPDDRTGVAEAIETAIGRGGPFVHQYRTRRADGQFRWLEANGRVDLGPDRMPRSFPGVLIDVEERRSVEAERDRAVAMLRTLNETLEQRVRERTRELHDAQDFTRLALSSVGGVGAWTYDVATDQFFCSAAIAELYGVDPAQAERGIKRSDFLANVHPDDLAALATTMANGLEHPGDLELEYRILHADGAVRWVLSRGYTYHEDGKPIRRVGIGVETTRQHELEGLLRQSQKMEAVGQLTGGLAHDFNNLLTGITGALELLGTRLAQGRTSEVGRYIEAAQGAAKRAASLTHRLLAFSRRQTLDPKPTDVNGLTRGMEELIRRTIGPSIALTIKEDAGLWSTLVDPPQLENALLNLCINARDAMPEGGRLTVETSNRTINAHLAASYDLRPGQYVSLCVSDSGSGMPPDVIARAFEPFFTTKPLGKGTGLGLSMIYGFARQSGGQARIHSHVNQGTSVRIFLPRHRGEADPMEPAANAGTTPRANQGETVLVVDDEPTLRMLVVDVLKDLGYAAMEASDGAAGLEILRSDVAIDLLVTDVGLPGGLNGRQMADAARVVRPGLKILFITGYAETTVIGDDGLDPGMHVLTKPFAIDALATRIRDLIAL